MVMAADPFPEAPLGIVSQDTFGVTLHEQPDWVVIVAVTLPAGMHGLKSTGATEVLTDADVAGLSDRERLAGDGNARTAIEDVTVSCDRVRHSAVSSTLAAGRHGEPGGVARRTPRAIVGAVTANVPRDSSFPNSALPGDNRSCTPSLVDLVGSPCDSGH